MLVLLLSLVSKNQTSEIGKTNAQPDGQSKCSMFRCNKLRPVLTEPVPEQSKIVSL